MRDRPLPARGWSFLRTTLVAVGRRRRLIETEVDLPRYQVLNAAVGAAAAVAEQVRECHNRGELEWEKEVSSGRGGCTKLGDNSI